MDVLTHGSRVHAYVTRPRPHRDVIKTSSDKPVFTITRHTTMPCESSDVANIHKEMNSVCKTTQLSSSSRSPHGKTTPRATVIISQQPKKVVDSVDGVKKDDTCDGPQTAIIVCCLFCCIALGNNIMISLRVVLSIILILVYSGFIFMHIKYVH